MLFARNKGHYTSLVFVDLCKAFDCVQHQKLINELFSLGVRDTALTWFTNYLSSWSQRLRIAQRFGDVSPCSRGVPQGSVLGPLLFRLYIRSLQEAIADVKCQLFADDILIYCSADNSYFICIAEELSKSLTAMHKWLQEPVQ